MNNSYGDCAAWAWFEFKLLLTLVENFHKCDSGWAFFLLPATADQVLIDILGPGKGGELGSHGYRQKCSQSDQQLQEMACLWGSAVKGAIPSECHRGIKQEATDPGAKIFFFPQ